MQLLFPTLVYFLRPLVVFRLFFILQSRFEIPHYITLIRHINSSCKLKERSKEPFMRQPHKIVKHTQTSRRRRTL